MFKIFKLNCTIIFIFFKSVLNSLSQALKYFINSKCLKNIFKLSES